MMILGNYHAVLRELLLTKNTIRGKLRTKQFFGFKIGYSGSVVKTKI